MLDLGTGGKSPVLFELSGESGKNLMTPHCEKVNIFIVNLPSRNKDKEMEIWGHKTTTGGKS